MQIEKKLSDTVAFIERLNSIGDYTARLAGVGDITEDVLELINKIEEERNIFLSEDVELSEESVAQIKSLLERALNS